MRPEGVAVDDAMDRFRATLRGWKRREEQSLSRRSRSRPALPAVHDALIVARDPATCWPDEPGLTDSGTPSA
eukprot:4384939-Lingulodinium_polyedra.AAC.1